MYRELKTFSECQRNIAEVNCFQGGKAKAKVELVTGNSRKNETLTLNPFILLSVHDILHPML